MKKLSPIEAMQLAVSEAKNGTGFVSPNPLVGCVILDKDSYLIGKGYHAKVGEAHAEINALASVADQGLLSGAQIFVTLEPCAHYGRTGPCAQALARLPIASVTYGVLDPNPLVSGKGLEILRSAGKAIRHLPEISEECEDLCEIFLTNIRLRRAFVALKVASSVDGQIALQNGQSMWITGESARQNVQALRGGYDAVLTGVGTFLKDNPRLNSRDPKFINRQQRVIILDPDGRSYAQLAASELVKVRGENDIFIVTGPLVAPPPVGQQVTIGISDGGFDLKALLEKLPNLGIHSILVEAGSATSSSFLKAQLVDRLYLFLALKILGKGLGWSSDLRLDSLSSAPKFRGTKIELYDQDLLLSGKLSWS